MDDRNELRKPFGLIAVTIALVTITIILPSAQANVLSHWSAVSEQPSLVSQPANTAPTGTYFDHLVFIMMENEGMADICRNQLLPPCSGSNSPYMSGLINSYGISQRYHSLITTSEPNYVGILGATTQGCTSSCGPGSLNVLNLVDRFESVGLSWKGYMEDQNSATGCDGTDHGSYQYGHNPFIKFHDINTNSTRCNKIALANPSGCGTVTDCPLVNDLNSASPPNFMWLTPNNCDNMHSASVCANGCTSGNTPTCIKDGDNFLKSLVPNILKSRAFNTTRSALFIAFDEGNIFCPYNQSSSEDCIPNIWAGPLAKPSYVTSNIYNHYSFTKTIETNWNLPTLTTNDAGATAMTEFFSTQTPDFTITASPTSLMFPFGNSANSTITLNSIGSFAGTVTLTKASTPAGLTLTLNPTSITLTAGGSGTSTLTVSSSQIGNYTATVTGTSGSHVHITNVTVQVTPPPNFALSASPSSLTLTHAVSGVASLVTVNSTGDPTVFESSYLANSFYAKGLIWIFYEDSRNTCEHQAGCLTYTTSLNGSKWAPPTTVPVHITDSDFSFATNGTSVFYARYNETSFVNDCGRKLQFGLGNLSNSGTVTWQPEKTVTEGASNRVYVNDEIIVDSNGQVWIAYMIDNHGACGGNSTDLPFVIHSSGTNYSVWTGNFTLSTATSGNWHIALASLGNGQVYASYWCCSSDVHGRLYNNGWQADEQISAPATRSDVNAWLFNSGTTVYTIYFDDSTKSFYFASRSSTAIWTINTIGIGESHTGFPGYYSLPDAASYDVANNQFHLFYMNATTQKIDEWTGSGNTWNKTTGVVSTGAVPYPDSITSFIESNPIEVGGIFYTSGSTGPFTINFAALTFASSSLTGSFTVTVASQNGFTGTVTLSTTTTPSTGLTVNCSVTTITGGSGSSLCSLNSTTTGNYNVNVTGGSGSLSHSSNVAVTVPAGPDFSISATSPTPTNVGQSPTSTITVTAVNGFTGVVSLTDTPPAGLTCGAISPSSITNSGTATVSCSATIAGNDTLTLTGTSGSLTHSTTAVFQFRDFSTSASSPAPINAGTSTISTITITAINHFGGVVTLTDTVPSGLVCGTVNPSSVTGSGIATVSCSAAIAGNYTLTITGTSASLVRTAIVLFQVRDFTISANSPSPVNASTSTSSTITITALNRFAGTVNLTSSAPSGLTCGAITPSSVVASGAATVSCNASIAGNYTLTITGTSGPLDHTATALFQFRDFAISLSPVTVNAGSSGTATITVTAVNRFAGTVTLTDIVPSGLTCGAIAPATITGSGTATVVCSANTGGNYTLPVTGTSSSLVHSALASFRVQDFSLTLASPTPVNAGVSISSTITLSAVNGFTGVVSLTDTLPSGLTCGSITPGSVTGFGTATVSCNATIAGNYTLTVTGTSGSLIHSATALFQFRNFTITASSPLTVSVGISATSNVIVTSLNHFGGVVSLSDAIPSGLTCGAINPTSLTGSGAATVSCNATIAGNYTLTITGTSGSLSHSATALFRFQDFSLTATSPAPVNAGQSATSTVTVVAVNGFAGTVTFTITPSPGLVCGSFSPSSVTGSGSATVSCNATIAGNYTATITGTSTPLIHNATATFQLRDFTIAATSPAPVNAGSSASSTITLTAVNHFAGSVSLSDAIPSGLTCGTVMPSSITGSGTATISCSTATAGNYTLTVTATSGSLVHNAIALFQFRDFGIVASTPAPINAGSSATSTITIISANRFAGPVSLTDIIPSGLTCGAISPTSITGSGSATVSCNSTNAGNHTLTVIGTSGSLSHSANALFRVQDFSISATSPTAANVGVSSNSTITITALNAFTGTVSLAATIPANLSCGPITPVSISNSGTATVSCSSTIATSYVVTITGTVSTLSHSTNATFAVTDFTVSATSPAAVQASTAATSTITIAAVNGFTGVVNLNDTIPIGLTCGAINPSSITGIGTAVVSCSSNIAGNYTLTVTGTNGTLSHSVTIVLSIQDYTIAANLANVRITAGSTGSSTITITSLNHFSGTVSLSASGTTGLTTVVNPASLSGGSGAATLTFSSGTTGNYTATVTSSSGTLIHSTTVTVQVVDFAVIASPNTVTMLAGTNGNSTITVTGLNGFSGTVNVFLSPSRGLTATTVPSSIAGSGNSIMTVNASLPSDYSVTVTAMSGSLSHTIGIVVHVLDYGLTGNPVILVAPVGSSTSSTLTVQSLNGYSGNVSLTSIVQAVSTASPTGGLGGGQRLIMAPTANMPGVTISPQSFQLSSGGTQQSIVNVSLPSNLPAGTYLVTVTAGDGILSHTIVIKVVVNDFSITGSPSSITIPTGQNRTVAVNLQSLNFFQGNVTLVVIEPSGGPTGTLSNSTVQLTIYGNMNLNLTIRVLSTVAAGNYTITVQATSGTTSHTLSILVTVTPGLASILAKIFDPHNSASITALGIFTMLTTLTAARIRTYRMRKPRFYSTKKVEKRVFQRGATIRGVSCSSSLLPFWRPPLRDEY